MAEFGEQLRKARQDKGMTQQSLAEQLYVARQTISRWEVGERYPDILMVKEIARVLDVEVSDLHCHFLWDIDCGRFDAASCNC